MHSMLKSTQPNLRTHGDLGSWCISGLGSILVTSDSLPTPSYPASSSEPKFAARNQEAGP